VNIYKSYHKIPLRKIGLSEWHMKLLTVLTKFRILQTQEFYRRNLYFLNVGMQPTGGNLQLAGWDVKYQKKNFY
jgi:hypothetical protein